MLHSTHTFHVSRITSSVKLIVPVVALVISLFAAVSVSANQLEQVIVRESDVKDISEATSGNPGWYKNVIGSGTFTTNTVHPYSIGGSAELSVSDPASYIEVGLYNTLPSLRLDEISTMGYATIQTANNMQSTSLQLGIDLDKADVDTSWQGRMVFEPYLNTSFAGDQLTDGIWQTWHVVKPSAVWWMTWSDAATSIHGVNPCPQSAPCAYAQIKTLFPNAGLNPAYGNPLILKAGSGWNTFTGYFDAPAIVTADSSKYWEFEPNMAVLPTSKEQCFKNGWKNFGTIFTNQGQCVSSISSKS